MADVEATIDALLSREAGVPDVGQIRSGKIMRRLLRDVAEGRTLGDVTTLANADIVEQIRDLSTTRAGEG